MPPSPTREARIGIVIPALDEQDSLPGVLRAIPRPPASVVVVVDNGSRDRTPELARAGGAVLLREPRRGYGSACLKGLAWLYGREPSAPQPPWGGGDVVVFLDADGSDRPEELARLVDPILRGEAEVVLGSRVLGGATREALSPQQRLGNALACALMQILFRARYTDLGPFRAIRADALAHLALSDLDYGWTVELQLKAAVAGLRVLEVPVGYRARSAGRSKISGTLLGCLGAAWKILGWILGWRLALWFTSRRIPRFPRSARSGC